jgi:transposase
MTIALLGIDLAKNVFALHGLDATGHTALKRPAVPRAKLVETVASLPPCTVAMESCSGAHHWARTFAQHGHTIKLIAPKFVTPFRMTGRRSKNDAADAAAICAAAQKVDMRFVPVKSLDQQARLMVHRARQGFVESRTAVLNRIRGLMSEFGIVMPLKANSVRQQACAHLDERIAHYDAHIRHMARLDPAGRLMRLRGIGETTATAMLAMVGNGHEFKSGRQFAAWLGLVPSQYSTGGKARLGRITKAGDAYLRTLLILGARAVLAAAKDKTDRVSVWAKALEARRGYWKTVVALAAKNARMAWAVLRKGEDFQYPS